MKLELDIRLNKHAAALAVVLALALGGSALPVQWPGVEQQQQVQPVAVP